MLRNMWRKKACLLIMGVIFSGVMAVGASDVSAGTEDYIGEISWFAGNFAPKNWATCDGQVLAINQNQALFALLGTTYGGNGQTTFALPDMRGRLPMHWGAGPGLTPRILGETDGAEQVTAQVSTVRVEPAGAASATAVSVVRGDNLQPHNNMQPYLGITCIINLYGIFPPRNW